MIVFWRLFLAYYLADFAFYGRRFYCWHSCSRLQFNIVHGIVFYALCSVLTYEYLNMDWPFLGLFTLKGWVCVGLFTLFHIFSDEWFNVPSSFKYHHALTFLMHDFVNLLFLFLCVPFDALYETGNFVVEPWVLFCVGLMFVTKVQGTFAYLVEKDLYGRDYPTVDEHWLMRMTRAIFFLIMLLPGWRTPLFLVVWWGACVYARKMRLMDVSDFSFFFGLPLAVLVGFLVRLQLYSNW